MSTSVRRRPRASAKRGNPRKTGELPRAPKLRGRSVNADSDERSLNYVDEIWNVEVYRGTDRERWSWTLAFPSLTCGYLYSEQRFHSSSTAVADVRRVLRRLLGAST
jgi:hypothetical protein